MVQTVLAETALAETALAETALAETAAASGEKAAIETSVAKTIAALGSGGDTPSATSSAVDEPTATPIYIPPTATDPPPPTKTKKPLPPPPTNTPIIDSSPPVISNPNKIGATVACMVTFAASITDDSEVVQVELNWGKNSPPNQSVNMSLFSGSTTNGQWRATFSVAGLTGSDQLRVNVRAWDWWASNDISNLWQGTIGVDCSG